MNSRLKKSFIFILLSLILISISLQTIKNLTSNEQIVYAQNEKIAKKKGLSIMEETDNNFWNYIKSNNIETYNLLTNIKEKYPRFYKRLLKVSKIMYKRINETSNPELKKIFSTQIDNKTKLTQLIITYKENKIKEEEFDTKAKQILTEIHLNNIKIMEIKIQEMKNQVENKVAEMLQKIKKEIK